MRRCVLLAAAAALWVAPASADMIITADAGGPISRYEERYAAVRAAGETVVIDGPCYSACTMVLGLVPRERVCVTPRARLGFHAAWFPDMAGGRVISVAHTQKLSSLYPSDVRHWISQRGGLSARTIVLEGRALRRFLAACPGREAAPAARLAASGHALEIPGLNRGPGRGL